MKVGLLQLNSTIGDFDGNVTRLLAGYVEACSRGADLVIAPEMFLCGYPPRDLLIRSDFIQRNLTVLEELAGRVGLIPLCLGFVDWNPERPGKPLFNSAGLLRAGKVEQKFQKVLLPTYDVFDEARYFEPGKLAQPFLVDGCRVGLTICEDIWNDEDFWSERHYRRDPVKELVAQGVDILVNLSASPWHQGKELTRLAMLQRVANDERLPLLQVNMVGGNDELIFDGQSIVVDQNGHCIHWGKSFQEEVVVVDLAVQKSDSIFPIISKEAQLYKALSLGIRDYVGKCGFKSVLCGLSGGIDSALTAVLAVEAVGAKNVMGIAMPSRFSSEGSLKDAKALATRLGIQFEVLPIEPAVAVVEEGFAGVFAGKPRNEAEENIQSRLRGLTLMALSNKFGSLVLTTGNKSEMAVGYCTLYGDMCGALAVIADLFKSEIYALSRWINRDGEIIPWESITKPPSAELRPDQKDQDSLPPYEVLDSILEAFVVRNLCRSEIISMGHPAAMVDEIINKVIFSEYKRRQAAPGLKVSALAFGMGRRIPIAQGFRH